MSCHPAHATVFIQDRLSIKGHPTEDAVVCTADKTYTLRSVVLSNTVLVLTPSRTDPDGTVHVRDQLHEVLELVPSVPKLHKLSVLLRGMEYDEGDEDRRVSHCVVNASPRGPSEYLLTAHVFF